MGYRMYYFTIYFLFEIQSHVSLITIDSFIIDKGSQCLISCKVVQGLSAQAHSEKSILIIS